MLSRSSTNPYFKYMLLGGALDGRMNKIKIIFLGSNWSEIDHKTYLRYRMKESKW